MVAQEILVSTKPFPAHEAPSVRQPDEAPLARLHERANQLRSGQIESVDHTVFDLDPTLRNEATNLARRQPERF